MAALTRVAISRSVASSAPTRCRIKSACPWAWPRRAARCWREPPVERSVTV
ncbi:Uncharacterised protein [Mycobacterium tuberculosis]|nr:Uncharacterised protein [Mycobacterium tuberculosis]